MPVQVSNLNCLYVQRLNSTLFAINQQSRIRTIEKCATANVDKASSFKEKLESFEIVSIAVPEITENTIDRHERSELVVDNLVIRGAEAMLMSTHRLSNIQFSAWDDHSQNTMIENTTTFRQNKDTSIQGDVL